MYEIYMYAFGVCYGMFSTENEACSTCGYFQNNSRKKGHSKEFYYITAHGGNLFAVHFKDITTF